MFSDKEKIFNDLIIEWNSRINLVSRKKKDVYDLISDSRLFEKAICFGSSVKIADIGTGGGFPGIVLAIRHPETYFTLVDSVNKKVNALKDIVEKLKLNNVKVLCSRVEELHKSEYRKVFDFVTARSVAPLDKLCRWSVNIIKSGGTLVTLKGGEITAELDSAAELSYVMDFKITDAGQRKLISVTFR
ncbi:MAG: 16S rRNA (guanine(527)-N(7))-methyltransferase RsmG [Ignavibacteria bacterium]|nr:16S rRNA (guanine(527)-N(7))-methyltransferase RsmG [Ignavibacteria bacterium]